MDKPSMIKKVATDQAPRAIGPYSQAIVVPSAQPLIFVSGQLPIDLQSGELIKGTIQILTRTVLTHIKAILISAGSDFEHIVRMDVFLLDLADFSGMNEEYARWFPSISPARQTVQVSALPKGAPLEISCIATLL